MAHDREVAGIRCTEVLAVLPEYLDESMPSERRLQVENHLKGCDWCERFGGEYAAAVASLRSHLGTAEPTPDSASASLWSRLEEEGFLPPGARNV